MDGDVAGIQWLVGPNPCLLIIGSQTVKQIVKPALIDHLC